MPRRKEEQLQTLVKEGDSKIAGESHGTRYIATRTSRYVSHSILVFQGHSRTHKLI